MMFRLLSIIFLSTLFISCNEYELEEDDCRVCYGRGYIYCTACKNTGFCTHCEHGWIDCGWCSNGYRWNAVGEYVKCTYCSDSFYIGKVKCPFCQGAFLGKCWACHGKIKICKDCNGTGKIQN